jgi:octaprenyl-diphosphate synthase
MFGDILYSKAFSELTLMDKDVAYVIADAVVNLSIGELADVELTKNFNSSYQKYYDMIDKKTASLIEASAKASAILANKDSNSYAIYGKNLGLAFQMIDDILDITSDSKTLGKPSMLDFVEGKVTIPYLLLYEKLDDKNKQKLKSMYKKNLSKDEILWIKENMKQTNTIQQSIKIAQNLGLKALEAIKDEKNDDLENIMQQMINREF